MKAKKAEMTVTVDCVRIEMSPDEARDLHSALAKLISEKVLSGTQGPNDPLLMLYTALRMSL